MLNKFKNVLKLFCLGFLFYVILLVYSVLNGLLCHCSAKYL